MRLQQHAQHIELYTHWACLQKQRTVTTRGARLLPDDHAEDLCDVEVLLVLVPPCLGLYPCDLKGMVPACTQQ